MKAIDLAEKHSNALFSSQKSSGCFIRVLPCIFRCVTEFRRVLIKDGESDLARCQQPMARLICWLYTTFVHHREHHHQSARQLQGQQCEGPLNVHRMSELRRIRKTESRRTLRIDHLLSDRHSDMVRRLMQSSLVSDAKAFVVAREDWGFCG